MLTRLRNYWSLTVDELLNKVSWPTWDELRSSTLIVLVASIIMAFFIYLMDLGLGTILKYIYKVF